MAIGWGKTEKDEYPDKLREVKIQMIDRALCNKNIAEKRLNDLMPAIALQFGISEKSTREVREVINKNSQIVTDGMICEIGRASCRERV